MKNKKQLLNISLFIIFLFLWAITVKWGYLFSVFLTTNIIFYFLSLPTFFSIIFFAIYKFKFSLFINTLNDTIWFLNILLPSLSILLLPYLYVGIPFKFINFLPLIFFVTNLIGIIISFFTINEEKGKTTIPRKKKNKFFVVESINFIASLIVLSVLMWLIIKMIITATSPIAANRAYLMQLLSDAPMEYKIIKLALYIVLFNFIVIKPLLFFWTKKIHYFFLSTTIWFFIFKKIKIKQIKIKQIFYPFFTLTPFLLSVPILAFSFKNEQASVEMPTKSYKNIGFSLNPKYPNIINIFSDGFDSDLFPINYENKLNGYYIFKNMISTGFFTTEGFSSVYYGDEQGHGNPLNFFKYNTSQLQKKEGTYYQKTIINPMEFHTQKVKQGNYISSFVGKGKLLENEIFYNKKQSRDKNDNSIRVLNWRQAQNIQNKRHPFSIKHPYAYMYNELIDGAHKSSFPSYTHITENISHHPYSMSSSGAFEPIFNFDNGSNPATFLIDFLNNLKNKLSKIKDSKTNINAFDNSLIYIYGDHGNHGKSITSFGEGKSTSKNITSLIIKPLYNKHIDSLNAKIIDNPISNTFVRKIVDYSFNHPINSWNENNSFDSWIKSETIPGGNFDPNRYFVLWTNSFPERKARWIIKYKDNNVVPFVGDTGIKNNGISIILNKRENGWLKYGDTRIKVLEENMRWK